MRRRVTKQQLAATIGVFAVLAAAGWWWSPHIVWKFMLSRNGAKVPSVPVTTLKAPGQTQGWMTCRAGALTFKLPKDFAESAERSISKKSQAMISFKTGDLEIVVHIPFKVPENAEPPPLVQMADFMKDSPIQMIAESYRTSTDDFRWTMSRDELRRHQMLVNLGFYYPQYQHARGVKAESLFEGPLEGMLTIHDKSQATYEWRFKSKVTAGVLGFAATGKSLDLDQVRDICMSISCDESRLTAGFTPAQMEAIVDGIEMTKE